MLPPDSFYVHGKCLVPPHPGRPAFRRVLARRTLVVHRRGDRQHGTDRLDPVRLAVGVDERHHHFARRSSATWRHTLRFLPLELIEPGALVCRQPGRRPASRSACRTQLRNVSAAQPIVSAIAVIAAHCEASALRVLKHHPHGPLPGLPVKNYSLASWPSAQGLEPPGKPGRFRSPSMKGFS